MNSICVTPLHGSLNSIKNYIEGVYTESEFLDPVEEIIKKTLHRDLSLPCGIFLEKKAIGFFSIDFSNPSVDFQKDEPSFWLESFMISGDFQKKGYGKAALDKIAFFLKKKYPHLKCLNLTVNLRNIPARTLYLKCGFVDTKNIYREGPAGPQHIFMKKL
ncbi:MAG: GNAT family N-acetyltransferase [Desulfobacula sp.]